MSPTGVAVRTGVRRGVIELRNTFTNGQVPTNRRRRTRIRSRGRPPASSAATAISPVGWMPRVNAALSTASAAGVIRPEMMARSMST